MTVCEHNFAQLLLPNFCWFVFNNNMEKVQVELVNYIPLRKHTRTTSDVILIVCPACLYS